MPDKVLFPSWRYHWSGAECIVKDEAHDARIGEGWRNRPWGPGEKPGSPRHVEPEPATALEPEAQKSNKRGRKAVQA